MKNKFTAPFTFTLWIVLLLLLSTSTVLADKNGRANSTFSGCTCHDQGTNTTVNITGINNGGTIYMRPNETRSFTAVVAHSSLTKAGINLSIKNSSDANIGTLNSGTGTKKLSNEIVHNGVQNMTNGQFAFGFSWVAPSTPGTYTMRAAACVGNNNNNVSGDEWNSMAPITIIVANASITLTNPNGGQLVCKGSKLLVSWSYVSIPGNVKIELSSNGGSTWSTLTTVPASSNYFEYDVPTGQTSATAYRVRVSESAAPSTNDMSDANFSILTVPVIVTQPKSDSVCAGGTVTFSVVSDNQPGYTYQWRRNTVPIQGATTTSYTITNAQQSNVADYDVIVTGCSPVTSNLVFFQLNTPPAIVSQTSDTAVCKGSPAILNCSATGTTLTYQWKKNGTNISGATSSSLSIAAVNAADTGNYTVTVSGKCPGTQTSNPINLRFSAAPVFVSQPRDTTACLGETIQYTANAGGNDITYQWRKDGKNIDNAVGNTFSILHITAADAGSYDVVAKNSCNLSTISSPALLKTRETTVITAQPRDTTVQAGISVTLTVAASGTGLKFQWQKNGINRTGDTLSTLTISAVKVSDTGNYKCVIKTACGNVESAVAKLKVTAPPAGAALALGIGKVDFGCVYPGNMKDTVLKNVVSNVGGQALNITNVLVAGPDAADYTITNGGGAHTIAPNQTMTMEIQFKPTAKGAKNATLEFVSNSSTAAPKMQLTGKGCQGELSTVSTFNAGKSDVGKSHDTTLIICNTGDYQLSIVTLTITGANKSDFSVKDMVLPLILQPNKCDTITITFNPSGEGVRTASITIETSNGGTSFPLEGFGNIFIGVSEGNNLTSGVSVYPNPTSGNVMFRGSVASPMPVQLRIFDALGNSILTSMVSVTNPGEFSIGWNPTSSPTTVSSGSYTAIFTIGSQTISVPFVIVR